MGSGTRQSSGSSEFWRIRLSITLQNRAKYLPPNAEVMPQPAWGTMVQPQPTETRYMERSLDTFAAELAAHPEGFGGLFDRMGYLVLLPLLGFPYPVVAERLVVALADAGVPETQAKAVSLRELVGFALLRATPYWAAQAV